MRKYIRSYKQYRIFEDDDKLEYSDKDENSVKVASDSLNTLIDQIKEFNSKKSNLEKLIMDNRGEDKKDISKNIEDIISSGDGRNKFLSMYVAIVGKMRKVANFKDKIDYFNKLMMERKGDLTNTRSLSDAADREEQSKKLNDQIQDITEKVKDMGDKIKDLENEISENKKDLEKSIKDVEQEMKKNVKDSEWDIKNP